MGVLAKVTLLDKVEINEDGAVSARFATYITEDGTRISEPAFHRLSFTPGEALPTQVVVDAAGTKTTIPARLKDVCASVWTKATVDTFKVKQAAAQTVVKG